MREALLKAGYSDSYASHNSTKFLHNREVQRYIRERQKQVEEAELVDAQFLLDNLKKIISDPQATLREKAEAMKILDSHLEWNKAIESRLKELEVPKSSNQPIVINVGQATKDV